MDDALRVFVVDDDPLVLRSIERVLRANGFDVETFATPEAFLRRPAHAGAACVLLDLVMPGLSGLDVQAAMARDDVRWPVIFLSGRGDIPSTARAMREGAVDFLVKPPAEAELVDAVRRAGERAAALARQRQAEHEVAARFARLTRRERQVCDRVAQGLLNKQIAWELGIGEQVVKVHRGRAMRKLEVDSVAALVRLVAKLPGSDAAQR
jgi:FixJ family two-component response regulator